jgi:hypothetical protein
MKQKIIIFTILLAVIFLAVEFLPGFNFGNKLSQKKEQPYQESDIVPTPTDTTSTSQEQIPTPSTPSQEKEEEKVAGIQYKIKSVSLLNLDKAIESLHFIVYFHSAHEKEAKELITAAEKDYINFLKFFKILPKTEVLITNDLDEYIDVFNAAPPYGREMYKDPDSGAGAFCPGCTATLGNDTEYIYMLRPKENKSFAHESSHRYFWANYPNLRNNNYNWINEGLAVYVQNEISPGPGGFSSQNLASLKNFTLPANLAQLEELQKKGDYESLERFYDLVGLLAIYISERNKDYGLQEFLTDLNNTKDVEKTCQNKLGFGLNQLLNKWQTAITQTVAENPVDFLANFKEKTMD